ncbi:MAG: hypothetical protein R2752_05495 [Vicinamibacterales bacterium]
MNMLTIDLVEDVVLPGGVIRGTARWQGFQPGDRLEVRLRWETTGKIVLPASTVTGSQSIDAGPGAGQREFEFAVPAEPLSVRGRLFQIRWRVELRSARSGQQTERDVVVSNIGRLLVLTPIGG